MMMTTTAPVLDEPVLAQLEEDLEDRNILVNFLHRFLELLDPRVHRLDHALTARDPAAWMHAVLSLRTASAMAGATALAEAAASLRDQVALAPGECRWPRPHEQTQIIADLRHVVEATREHLMLFLRRFPA